MKPSKILIILLCIGTIGVVIAKELRKPSIVKAQNLQLTRLVGDFNNYQQYTAQENNGLNHGQFHLKIDSVADIETALEIKIFKGINQLEFVESEKIEIKKNQKGYLELHRPNREPSLFVKSNNALESQDGYLRISGDTLSFSKIAKQQFEKPFQFIKCRHFAGDVTFNLPDVPDSLIHIPNLMIHDQGGMVDFTKNGLNYTVELKQMTNNKKQKVMQLAFYKDSMKNIGKSNKPVCTSWANTKATRLGINNQQIQSNWALKAPAKKKPKKKKK